MIRMATPADVPALVDLNAGLFATDAARHDPTVDQDWSRREGAGYFEEILTDERSDAWLAVVGDEPVGDEPVDYEPVGYAVGRRRDADSYRPVATATLESMFVRAEHRSAGVGAALVAAFTDWARAAGAQFVHVTAHVGNERAVAFYRRQGFAPLSLTLRAPVSR
jgi:GNAT superfamily N-acetyltransferase